MRWESLFTILQRRNFWIGRVTRGVGGCQQGNRDNDWLSRCNAIVFSGRQHHRDGWTFAVHVKNTILDGNHRRGGVRRTVVPGLVTLTPLTFSMALASVRCS